MLATNAAFAFGGMTHRCLSHGFRSSFAAPARRWTGRPPRPPSARPVFRRAASWPGGPAPRGAGSRPGRSVAPPGRRRACGTGGLAPSSLPALRLLLVRGGVQPLGGEPGAGAPGGVAVDAQRLGDAVVGPVVWAVGVGSQQDGGAPAGVGRVSACAD